MSGNFVVPVNNLFIGQYYKSVNQNLTSGATDITFDLTQTWNNTGGYVTHTNGSTDFTVNQTGLYQLEFNTTITAATWTDTLKQISIDLTRSPFPEQVTIIQNAAIPTLRGYGQSLSAIFYLVTGDVINCRVVNTYTSGTPQVVGDSNPFELNTWFTWKYIH